MKGGIFNGRLTGVPGTEFVNDTAKIHGLVIVDNMHDQIIQRGTVYLQGM